MGKSTGSAPAPDPNIGKSALMQAETGQQWLGFAKDAFQVSQERQKELDALTTRVTEQQLGLATDQAKWARDDRARYDSTFKPIEDQFVQEASNYGSEARQQQAAGEARADVAQAGANARAATERNAAAMGINPTSGRYAGIQATNDMNQTLTEASAANSARQAVRDKGLALKADVANLGRGLPASAAGGAAGSVSASGTALGGAQATNGQAMAAPGIVAQGYQGQMAGYAGQGSLLNQQYGIQMDGWRTQQQMAAQSAAGIGSFLGGIFKALPFTSDENLKQDKTEVPDGAALEAVNNMPVTEWTYLPGVEDGGRHIGPMAQDFKRETGKGDGKSIAPQDAIGLALKAVQDLSAKVDRIGNEIGLGGDVEKMPAPKKNARTQQMERIAA